MLHMTHYYANVHVQRNNEFFLKYILIKSLCVLIIKLLYTHTIHIVYAYFRLGEKKVHRFFKEQTVSYSAIIIYEKQQS